VILLPLAFTVATAAGAELQGLLDAGHFKRARALAEPRFQKDPKDAEAAYALSVVRLAYGDDEGARRLAETAVGVDAQDPRFHFQLGRVLGTMGEKAGLFKKLGFAKGFRSETERAIALDPGYLDPKLAMIEFYLQAPGFMGGDHKKAEAMAREIGEHDPAAGFRAQMRIAQEQKDVRRQESAGLEALKVNPGDYEAAASLASFYLDAKNDAQAEVFARRAVQIDPTRSAGHVLLTQAIVRQGKLGDLDLVLEGAGHGVPDDLSPFYQAGRELLVRGTELTRAEAYFRKYLTVPPEGESPDHAHAHWRLALVLEKENRKAEAITELQAALVLKPDFPEAHKDLGRMR
jgi:tetratricopeptide (TPR) repeat protein